MTDETEIACKCLAGEDDVALVKLSSIDDRLTLVASHFSEEFNRLASEESCERKLELSMLSKEALPSFSCNFLRFLLFLPGLEAVNDFAFPFPFPG